MKKARWTRLCAVADEELRTLFGALPEDMKRHLDDVALEYLPVPPPELVAEGEVEADTLGLFTGPALWEPSDADWISPTISLYIENLDDFCEGDERAFRREVRTTWLHEFGHYLGLEEDDLAARGLE